MKTIISPKRDSWKELIERPSMKNDNISNTVLEILDNVKRTGDSAMFKYTHSLDGAKLDSLLVSSEELDNAGSQVSKELKDAIELASSNIEKFHFAQKRNFEIIETSQGVKCWRKQVPIEKVGLYIPGGSAPLFSSILMLVIPAKIAACEEIIICTPPNNKGEIHPAILYTCSILGVNKVYKCGGAQAIAAMAYGTESIPQVDKIFGPGNQYVTMAKSFVQQSGVAIDMPAGPSELLIIADSESNPVFIAADLLSQAEHGPDSQVILVSDSKKIIDECLLQIDLQLKDLPRKDIASISLQSSKAIYFDTIDSCVAFSNYYAPEHLIINTKNEFELAEKIKNAGSVFLGKYSCESSGDYASGTNHTLPTNGFARNYSGVSLESFCKTITFQNIDENGIKNIGPAVEIMAQEEGLVGHARAVSIRLNSLKDV